MSKTDSLPYVEAELNYLGPMTERPRYYAYEIGERSNMTYDPHKMRIHDMRPISSDVSLDTQGFAFVEQRSAPIRSDPLRGITQPRVMPYRAPPWRLRASSGDAPH